jgi:branched-subunit amino acid aminotransferase/4-amino-4-deoxychorismate lyase
VTDFRLLETMRVGPHGGVYLLERHLARLQGSARFFEFKCEVEKLRELISQCTGPSRLRVLLARSGEFDLEAGPLPQSNPAMLKISPVRVHSANPLLYHKTTNREIYDQAGAAGILVNERGEITETAIVNIAVLRGGRWITPALACGLLPGVLRAELLSTGEIHEGVIRSGELVSGETIRCLNALRGVFEARYATH